MVSGFPKRLILALVTLTSLLTACSTWWDQATLPGEPAEWFDLADAVLLLHEQRVCCQAFDQLDYDTLALAEEQRLVVDNWRDKFHFVDGASYFVALSLPRQPDPLVLELRSLITDSVFSPTLLLLDETYTVTRRLGADTLQVQHNQMLLRDSLFTQLVLTPNERYLVIYSSQEQQQGETRIPHGAKLYAQSRGSHADAIPDLTFPHAPVGNLVLTLRPMLPGRR